MRQDWSCWHQTASQTLKADVVFSSNGSLCVPLDWGRRIEKIVVVSKFWETGFYWQEKKKSLSWSKVKQSPKCFSPKPWSRKCCVHTRMCAHTHTHTNNDNEQNQKTPENDLSGRKKGEWNSPHFASISLMKFLQMNKLFLKVLRTIILHYMPTHRLHLVQNNILVFARFSKETK